MNRIERLYGIDGLLQERTIIPVSDFLEELEVSPATFKRDLEYLRGRLNTPIVWNRDAGGYRSEKQHPGDKYESWISTRLQRHDRTNQERLGDADQKAANVLAISHPSTLKTWPLNLHLGELNEGFWQ